MYPTMTMAVAADRIRGWHEQAARDRLVRQARRARRAAAGVAAQRVPADATPDQWASALSAAADDKAGAAAGRQPVGGRAA